MAEIAVDGVVVGQTCKDGTRLDYSAQRVNENNGHVTSRALAAPVRQQP